MQILASIVDYLNQDLGAASSTLKSEVVAGISVGALVVFLVLMLIPVLAPNVHTRAFLKSFFRGIIASAVYLVTDYFYHQMEVLGRFYLIAAMAGAIVVTFIFVEIIVSLGKRREQNSLRTDISASIASGMAFSLLVKLAGFAWESLGIHFGSS